MDIRNANVEMDVLRITELINVVEPEPVSPADVRRWFEHLPPGRISRRRVAVNDGGQVVGYSTVVHEAKLPEGFFVTWVTVDANQRSRGIGRALAADIQAFLDEHGTTRVLSEVREDDARGIEFARRCGYEVERHLFESTLNLDTFDEAPLREVIPALEAQGIHFFTLADQIDDPQASRKLYAVNSITAADIPGSERDWMTYEEFVEMVMGASWFRPEGQLFASDGDPSEGAEWVGLAGVRLLAETNGAYNLMTGVLRPYRGRKIALALKLLAIRYARAQGAAYIRTTNDSLNAPMLAINQKLGYQRQPGKYILVMTTKS